ncbi:Similar to hypothetical protein TRIATDRAFT_235024 [Trichoderma atroviride IMI 206040]; acc. no. EHK49555 [Pyronema omphalodes CBS 100304]|uniref:Uncharacterized protein n=1 Tax=Pyronema omphalodes (strain CBS 100304) TaxID=1076935 RepID=U4L9Y1_PYROM|nr:Similar to hypothetical protein TRIATDRAFT_235024 [Trichoderma atroviride IMI 206040]; acc. no. EHK49555 [Pyronema omphalodes CBS 100304]
MSNLGQSGAMIHRIDAGIAKLQDIAKDGELEKVLQSISPLEPYKRHQDIKSKQLDDTGNWFL